MALTHNLHMTQAHNLHVTQAHSRMKHFTLISINCQLPIWPVNQTIQYKMRCALDALFEFILQFLKPSCQC